MKLLIKKLHNDAKVPSFAHDTDAAMDLYTQEAIIIAPGEQVAAPTGIAMAIPEGHVGLIWDKSGVAVKRRIKTMAGVVDAGYRGEVLVALLNVGTDSQTFEKGEKIAQMLIQKIEHPVVEEVDELDETERGEGGFGSTGAK